jgi:lysophospholipase L1-like esterase
MNRRSLLQNVALVTVTAGLASATTYWLTRPRPGPPRGIYVQMGTSITAGLHGPGANLTPTTVGSRLNLMPVNVGFDGACAATLDDPSRDEFSLCRLVDAVISGDWSAQNKAAAAHDPVVLTTLSRFKAIDFNKVTHLGLEYGANDFTLATPIGTSTDTTHETFKGALNYSIRRLLTAYPQLHLFLIAPSWRLNFEDLDSDTHPNARGVFLRAYVDAMIDAAALNHIPCLDMWRTLGLGINNYKRFTFDGTHPNEAGAIQRGEAIAAFIRSVF